MDTPLEIIVTCCCCVCAPRGRARVLRHRAAVAVVCGWSVRRRLHLEIVLRLEELEELLERELAPLVDVEAVPQRPLGSAWAHLVLRRGDGLGEGDERQREVGECVLVVVDPLLGLRG